ncbi:thiamine-phosphate kinase [Kocuria sp. JC486]|nr:thiamine-phosphate kinase [Kocuria sp. JC486]
MVEGFEAVRPVAERTPRDEPPRSSADADRGGLTVDQLSETQLIARFAPHLRAHEPGGGSRYEILGPGDDCAVVAAPDGRFVISTDTQVQGQDFELTWPNGVVSTGFDTGHKCATQNLADAAAMGAVPSALVVSLTLPGRTSVRWVEDFARGLRAGAIACGAVHCGIVGGDLGRGGEISATATVTGDLEGRAPIRRNGARPGDLVVLAGTVGRSAAGLDLLQDPSTKGTVEPYLVELMDNQLRPVSPTPLGAQLAEAGATAMIDVSDGLVRDLTRVAEASDVVVDLDPAALDDLARPLAAAGERLGRDPLYWVLHGGEDHGLLSTVPAGTRLPHGARPLGSVRAVPPGWGATAVVTTGTARESVADRVRVGTTPVRELPAELRGRGWDHFEPEDGV